MIKFFRRIRQRLLSENKFSKYLLYAVGEITLVMIGILLALQVNNWNEERKENITEQNLLHALHEDLLINIDRLNASISLEQRSIKQANYIVKHLDERKPYSPSLDIVFAQALYSPDIIISKSSYESIRSIGFDIIHTDALQRGIINLFDMEYAQLIAETVRLENQFWPSSVLPMVHKHFRETEYRKHTPINYEDLMEDTTYKNMLMHRIHFRRLALELKTKALYHTEELVEMIEKSLETI
ncbi:DUF6090 family protein [Muriicola sp. Z0-33]|uniref:DUF6090 family protein n=1 Tax=Muriicola sp. Z0-33 TaxID=2816957 RepID=UPI0022374623|nr:DUF6090 family protein [Muriicola sp. Z0-33]MCW5515470.1 hypothetical protein [Muriicola sp. Z0-33]